MTRAFATAFGLIGVAELGDKSRLVGLMLVAAFRAPWPVFVGMTLGFLVLDALAVGVGAALGSFAPAAWLPRAAGALFVVLGAAAILLHEGAEEYAKGWLERRKSWGALAVSFVAIAGSEAFDRTQLACAALAAETRQPVAVLAGAMAALALLNLATVLVGERLTRTVPTKLIYRASGALFVAAGLWMLFRPS